VALFDMLLNTHNCSSHSCKKSQHIKSDNEWKVMAALNLLLFELKLKDDVSDENSFIAKLLLKLYHKPIIKAKRDFPQLASIIEQGNKKIITKEKVNADAMTVAENFAKMMIDIAENINPLADYKSIIKGVSMWLYIIDAIDDYKKDLKNGNFNPFLNDGKKYQSFSEYMFVNFDKTTEMFRTIYACFSPVRGRNDINTLLYEYLPATTLHILKGKKMRVTYPLNKIKKYSQIEVLEREQFNFFVDSGCNSTVVENVIKSVNQSVRIVKNDNASSSLKLTIEQSCLQFDDWLINGKTDIFLFSDIVKLIYKGIPHNCEYDSCLGKYAHITANKQITFCSKAQNGITFNGQNFTEIFESAEFVNLLEQTIVRREECKSQCVAFSICGGGCPLKEKSKSDCDFRIKLYLHVKNKINNGNFNTFNKFVKNAIYRAVAMGGGSV
jgi:radical SAM protein with 4Fe4S-binding SPASM domain